MFPTKCKGENDRMRRTVISCFCQHLDVSIRFATNNSMFSLNFPSLLRFLCLRKCVSCIWIYVYINIYIYITNVYNTFYILIRFEVFHIGRTVATLIGHSHMPIAKKVKNVGMLHTCQGALYPLSNKAIMIW